MDETIDQIEAHIDRTRERLGSNLEELERRVDAATDWRQQFRTRPYVALGVAFAGGLAVATVLQPRSSVPSRPQRESAGVRPRSGGDAREQAIEVLNNIKTALLGVATTRVKDFIGELVPGFHEQYARSEQRTTAAPAHGLRNDG